MKITIEQVYAAVQGFVQLTNQPLPNKTAYWVNKIGIKLDKIKEPVDKILAPLRYEVGDEKAIEKEKKFMDAYNELKDNEEEIFDYKFKIEDFGDAKVRVDFFQLIAPFLDEE